MSIGLRGLTILALVLGMLLADGAGADASHSWSTYHWARTTSSFTLALGDNLTTAGWKGHLTTAAADWSMSNVLNTVVGTGQSGGKQCRPTSGRVEVCNRSYGSNGWLGLAQIWISGSHITQGVAKMNDTYFNTTFYNNPNEKLHVMCQEVGHTFGLGHTSENGSSQNTCMDYFSNTGANAGSTLSTRPNQHDYDQLATIYAHLDSTSTIAAGSATRGFGGANGADGDGTPGGASKAKGRWYVEALGGGRYLVTHITWVD